jgi:hypothetical protein
MKSCPGLAVPDSVHQVNVAAPWRLPRRRTMMRAAGSVSGTSMVSAASSTREGGRGPAGTRALGDEVGRGALGALGALEAGAARGELAAPRPLAASLIRSFAGLGGGELEAGAACGAGELGGAAACCAGGSVVLSDAEGCAGEEGRATEAGCSVALERSDCAAGASDCGSESFAAVDSGFLSPPK